MAKLEEAVKQRIVSHLACYDTPSEVVELIKAEYGIVVSRQQVEAYDPTKVAGAKLQIKWVVIFEKTREKFLVEVNEIPIAHRAYRLRSLDRMLNAAQAKNNHILAAKLMEQAAKECGGYYGGRTELKSKPVQPNTGIPIRPEYVLAINSAIKAQVD